MNRPLPDNGIPVKHGDVSFVFQGVYHPIVWYGEEPYRPRVETLVIKDGRYVYLNMYDTEKALNNERIGNYELPGGSIDNDCDKITQAENEVNEEILVKIKNIYHTGVQYYETFSDENVEEFKKESPLSYRGFISEVYCAEYAGKFDAKNVEEKDLDPEMQKGKFHPIALVADKLTEPHITVLINCPFVNEQSKMALRLYVRARGVTIESIQPVTESNKDTKNIYVVSMRYNSVFGKVVRGATNSQYNHSAISLDNTLSKMYTFVREKTTTPHSTDGGFSIENINDMLNKDPNTYAKVVKIPVNRDKYEALQIKLDNLTKFNDTTYDWTGVFRIAFGNRPNLKDNSFVCSTFTAYCMDYVGVKLPKDASLMTPEDVSNIMPNNVCYEGPIKKYTTNNNKIKPTNYLNASYNDVKQIVDSIPKNEHHLFYNGNEFVDSPNVVYRDVKWLPNVRGKVGAFIEIYSFEDAPDAGVIVIGAHPAARGKGLTDKLISDAIDNIGSIGITRLVWRTDRENNHSLKLAKRHGFEIVKSDSRQYRLERHIEATGVTESSKDAYNDKGKPVPKVCPKCGAKVSVFLRGEPVFLCTNEKCTKYFGTVPFDSVKETMRSELPNDAFGIPEERKYPLDTEDHVRSAIKLFNHVDDKYEAELARNIIKKMDEYNINDITIGEKNRLSKYVNESVITEASVTKKKPKYKAFTEKEAQRAAERLMKHPNVTLQLFGRSIRKGLSSNFENFMDILGQINALFYTGAAVIPGTIVTIIGVLLLMIGTLPFAIIAEALKRQKKFLQNSIRKDDKLIQQYYDIIDNAIKTEGNVTVIESMVPVLEAPGDDEEDEVTDYTDDVDDTGLDDDDELTDYTDDTEEPGDSEEDESTDYTEDVEDSEDEDVTGEEPAEDETGEEPTDEESEEDAIGDEEDEVTDYTDEVEDTGDDTSTDETDVSTDDTQNTDVDKNSIVKNYNLILDFQTLFRYVEDICTGLESTVFKSPIQNSALTQIVNNMRKIKNSVANYIEFNFGNDYVTNLYNYNIFVKALKLNLEMLNITKDLHTDKSTNK